MPMKTEMDRVPSVRICGAPPWFLFITMVLLVMAVGNGCSVYMATRQPDKKDLDVLAVGTPRAHLLAELGQPTVTEMRDDKRVDVFSFVQGYSKGAKTGRAVFHGVADALTLGLWEVVGTPTEASFTGEKVAYEVTYGESDMVENVKQLLGQKEETRPQNAQQTHSESEGTNFLPRDPSPEMGVNLGKPRN